MWPWGHAAVGYVLVWLFRLARRRDPPTRAETVVVLFGTQLPDLIDEPLAWTFDVLPTGRSLGHSLFTVAVLVVVALVVAERYDRRPLAVVFGIGYLSAVLTDLPASVLAGDFSRATFLLWPVLPSPEYETSQSFLAHLATFQLTSSVVIQTVLTVLAISLWFRHSLPRS